MNHFKETKQMSVWAQSIGGLFINFGGAEYLSLVWIQKMAGDKSALKYRKEHFSTRINFIIKLIAVSGLSPEDKEKAADFWNEIKGLSPIRNRIAHNPLSFGNNPVSGEEILTIYDTENTIPNTSNAVEHLGFAKIAKTALRIREINLQLDSLLKAIPLNKLVNSESV